MGGGFNREGGLFQILTQRGGAYLRGGLIEILRYIMSTPWLLEGKEEEEKSNKAKLRRTILKKKIQ